MKISVFGRLQHFKKSSAVILLIMLLFFGLTVIAVIIPDLDVAIDRFGNADDLDTGIEHVLG